MKGFIGTRGREGPVKYSRESGLGAQKDSRSGSRSILGKDTCEITL